MLADYHVHLETGPYSLEWLEKYFLVAKKEGIEEIGFSEHGYRFLQAKDMLVNPWIAKRQTETIEEYVCLIMEARRKKFRVKLGVELDYLPGKEEEIKNFTYNYPWDYVIGSVHWLDDWGFDLGEMRHNWEGKEIFPIYQSYFQLVKELIKTGDFEILGHADVIKVFGYRVEPEKEKELLGIYEEVADLLREKDMVAEVNTAGLRKPVGEIYPAYDFLKILVAKGVPLMLNSDAHHPEHVGFAFKEVLPLLKELGVRKLARFDRHERLLKEID